MAKSDAVWGIDIGQCSLKALRCTPHERQDRVVAEAFDYIEYPKILSQPGADPVELVGDALKQFLSRNSVRGDSVALAVPGQNGLARFIKLPPVESKRIPDIVRYEARQQIPFDLDDVVWDYQRMGGGSEEEGFSLETEIGLFAMKREQVFRALEPLRTAGIEVDVVQLTPLALYNFLVFDQMTDLPPPDEYDPENPPTSIVILSLGTDATDLIVTNGFRVWQRSIPLGGSHFTKALTKELKLTFAKAEHLKRNATAAQDPKAVFQAMRPVFNDLLTEIQRSIGYFSSLNRRAKLGKVVALGNGMKLPGLRKYLSQSLGMEVVRLDGFRGMSGSQVTGAPAFKENQLSFGVCYGLTLQTLNRAMVTTNLLPKEIVQDRIIREKKPWAVAVAAALMLGCTISFASFTSALTTVQNKEWTPAESKAKTVKTTADGYKADAEKATTEFEATDQFGVHLIGNVEGRILWLELLRAVNECLPYDPPEKRPEKIELRNELYVTNIDAQKVDDLGAWFNLMRQKGWYKPPEGESDVLPDGTPAPGGAAAAPGAAAAATPGVPAQPGAAAPGIGAPAAPGAPGAGQPLPPVPGAPSGPGWVVQISGYHLHNFTTASRDPSKLGQGATYLRNTLIKSLRGKKILLPVLNGKKDPQTGLPERELVSMEDLGIRCPVLLNPKAVRTVRYVDPNAVAEAEMAEGGPEAVPTVPGGEEAVRPPVAGRPVDGKTGPKPIELRVFDFVVQFAWQPTPPSVREKKKQEEKEKEQAANGQQPEANAQR